MNTVDKIKTTAARYGTDFIGFAPAQEWTAYGLTHGVFSGQDALVPVPEGVRTLIVLGAPLLLPVLETCPSVWGLDQEHIVSNILDRSADRIAAVLTDDGESALILQLREDALAAAAYVAGLGDIGENHRLLTAAYGPRVRLSAVATSLTLSEVVERNALADAASPMSARCLHCGNCSAICPSGALQAGEGFSFSACNAYEASLAEVYRNPCAACLKACPVGADRALYQSEDCTKYLEEETVLKMDPGAPAYSAWTHVRSFGSFDDNIKAK